jgi:heme A synthase
MVKAEVHTQPVTSHTSPPRTFARYAWGVLAYNLAVVLWGAFVRASGSGSGCGNHWPLCNGQVMLHSPALTTIVEFTHRATSGPVDTALILGLLVWAFRAFPRRHPVRLGASITMLFLVSEALFGAALVLLGQVGNNASIAHAWWLAAHLINTLTLLACLALTAWWAGGKPPLTLRGRPLWLAAASLTAVAILSASGVIAALGDTLFPVQSLAAGLAQDWDPSANLFLRLRGLHPLIAAGVASWLLYYAASSASRRPDVRIQALTLAGCVGAQILAGAINLLLLAPIWMQMVHLLLADCLWISLVLLSASNLAVREESI